MSSSTKYENIYRWQWLNKERAYVQLVSKLLGEVSEDVLISLINIGSMKSGMKDYKQSYEYYQQAKEMAEKLFSPDDPMFAHVYSGLGVCYSNLGELDKAIECHTLALNIRKNAYGDTHPILGGVFNNLAMAYYKTGDFSLAKDYYDKAVKIWADAYGEDNSRFVTLYGNIALMYVEQGEIDTAIRYYEEALRVSKKLYGDDSPITEEVLPSLYSALESLVNQSPTEENKKRLADFMADKVPACIVISGGPAYEQGLRGKCVVMEYCGWTIDSGKAMFHLVAPTAGKPKDIALMHDGKIDNYHFEDRIGVRWVLWIVSAERKQEMMAEYRKWKK
ncbi:MAG: tetratricopeptide repeat protein [Prevotella sp.]|nr:tetratricopeptide repeat protein [Prevotella sp.]